MKTHHPKLLLAIHQGKDTTSAQKTILELSRKLCQPDIHFLIIGSRNESLCPTIQAILDENQGSWSFYQYQNSEDINGLQFKQAIYNAYDSGCEYLITLNHGAFDCLEDFFQSLEKGEIYKAPASFFYRIPNKWNLGRLYNFFASLLATLSSGTSVKDVKGDGINVFKVDHLVQKSDDMVFNLADNNFYFWDLLQKFAYHRKESKFLSASPLQTPGSTVELNTQFFVSCLKRFFLYTLRGKVTVLSNKSSTNPRSLYLKTYSHDSFKVEEFKEKETLKTRKETDHNPNKKVENETFEPEKKEDTSTKEDTYIKEEGSGNVQTGEAKLIRLEHEDKKHKNVIVVNWCLTNICNYKCTYCPEELHNGTQRGPKLEDIQNFFNRIKKMHPDKKVFFEFTGGEVTYYKQFPELIRYIKESGGFVGILSNGARKLDFWEKHSEFIDHICLSFHSEQGEPGHFLKVAQYLCQRVSTHINIMMKPENFNICYDLASDLATDCEVSIAMQPLLENMDGEMFGYSEYQKKILDDQILYYGSDPKYKRRANFKDFIFRGAMEAVYSDGSSQSLSTPELIAKGMNQWSGWKCNIGIENLIVNLNGNIQGGWCGVGGVMGNVSDEEIVFPTKPVVCNKKMCNCGQDIMASKSRV